MLFLFFGVLSLVSFVAASYGAGGSLRARRAPHKHHVPVHSELSSSFSSVDIYKAADFLNDT